MITLQELTNGHMCRLMLPELTSSPGSKLKLLFLCTLQHSWLFIRSIIWLKSMGLEWLALCILMNPSIWFEGAQWLISGRVLDSRPRGRKFEPHRRPCSLRRFFWVPTTYVLVENKNNNFQLCTLIWRPDLGWFLVHIKGQVRAWPGH